MTMAVSIPAADHGWTGGVVYFATQEAAALEKKYPGLKVVVKTSPDPAAQANALEDLSTQGMDALVMPAARPERPDRSDPQGEEQGDLRHRRRPYRERPLDLRPVCRRRHPGIGRNAAVYMKEKMGGKGDIVIIRGLPIPIDEARYNAFMDGIKGTDIKVLDSQYGNWSRDDAFKVMQDFLVKHPKIDAVWAQDDDMVVGISRRSNRPSAPTSSWLSAAPA